MQALKYALGTAAIVALVVGLVWLQPHDMALPVAAAPEVLVPETVAPQASVPAKPAVQQPVRQAAITNQQAAVQAVVGVTQTLSLVAVDQLWQRFEDNTALHAALKPGEATVWVWYRDFSADFAQAKVTIGYPQERLFTASEPVVQVPSARMQKVASSSAQGVWQQLDYARGVIGVVEKHRLDYQGELLSSEFSVLYASEVQ
ncbi:hypothetical protein [Atopomonas hussainii]|uniref:hypothetical protein n=1 Tax=Atopomonas hussainii TaxID=1429083 RepID=UPI0009000181|nr:hypothetical protein [Atopomonas hussainii]